MSEELKNQLAEIVKDMEPGYLILWTDLGRMVADGEDPDIAYAEFERRLRLYQQTGMVFRSAAEPPPLGAAA